MQNFMLTTSKIQDNIQFFKENSEKGYVETIKKIIESDPFLGHKFYIQSFIKRVDDSTGVKKMIHHPRLTKPEPLPGHTLLRVDPKDPDSMKIMWTIPNQETFGLYKYKKAFGDRFVYECIQTYQKNPKQFMQPEPDDLSDDQIREIYKQMKQSAKPKTISIEN